LPRNEHAFAKLQRKNRLVALRTLLKWPTAQLSPELIRALGAVRSQLAMSLRTHPDALLQALGNPDVLCPLLVLTARIEGQDPESLLRAALPALVVTVAGEGMELRWDLAVSEVPDCRHHRVIHFDPPVDGLVATADRLEAERSGEAFSVTDGSDGVTETHPFIPILDSHPHLHFSLYDSNPLSMFELHPDKEGNAISLGDKPIEMWVERYRKALSIIEAGVPGWYAESLYSLDRIVPVGYMPERHLSASYREAPGLVYATLCDTPMTLAEAIIHETQHGKLNTLTWLDEVITNGHDVWIDSPVRPDLRPLWGVLLAAHAFVPVSAMYDRLTRLNHPITQEWDRFKVRRAEVIAVNDESVGSVAEHSETTRAGRKLVDEMVHLHQQLKERASAEAAP